MASTAAQDKLRKQLVWTTTDNHGNEVICTAKAWSHVLDGHPEMSGMERHVIQALQTPDRIKPSTINPAAFGFEFTTEMSIDVRVVAAYDEPHLRIQGQTIGKVSTAMPIDEILFASPNLGAPVYEVGPQPAGRAAPVARTAKEVQS